MNKNVSRESVWTAIDIGTTKICALVAGLNKQGAMELLGVGQYPSSGLKKGVVVDVARTVASIKAAVAQAEKMSGIKITSATVGISGGHIQSFNAQGAVPIKHRDVTQEDIDRVIAAAKAVVIPPDREILHVLPQYFKVDGQDRVQDSLGMCGVRLEAQVHIITGSVSSANTIITCCEQAGVQVQDIVLEQLASAEAVLTDAEREMGVGILDIGGGTSDFAIYKDGRIVYSKVIAIAGAHFTNDCAVGLRISPEQAERLKRSYGFVYEDKFLDLDATQAPLLMGSDARDREVDLYEMYEILHPRARELFGLVLDEMVTSHLRQYMPFGLVITGGGALLRGICELAESMFDMPVRLGMPQQVSTDGVQDVVPDILKSPIYSTGYGLLRYAMNERNRAFARTSNGGQLVSKVFKRMKSWLYDFM